MIAAAVIIVAGPVRRHQSRFAGALRRLVRDEADVERRLRAPDAHTISYAVPNGVDPGDLRVAATRGRIHKHRDDERSCVNASSWSAKRATAPVCVS